MKLHRNATAPYRNSALLIRPLLPSTRSRREDRIFHYILPVRLHTDDFSAEAPGDWGNRILSEGDLLSPLNA